MTDDDEAAVQSATNAPTEESPRLTYGWGTPKGRTRCSGCDAEGVNIRTCPGDGSPHLATTEYVDRSRQGERPGDAPGAPPRSGYDPTLNEAAPGPVEQVIEAMENLSEAVEEEEPQAESWGALTYDGIGRDPGRADALQVSHVTVRLATTYPALAAARLEAFIEESLDECLWLATDIRDLT